MLSAKHGLGDLEQVSEPYNLTLNEMPARDVKRWAASVLEQLHGVADLRRERVVFFPREKYRKYVLSHISNYGVPLQGLSIGKQMKLLKEELSHC